MDGRQWSLEGIVLATDELSKVKAAVAAQTGIHEDDIIFENGYDPEGSGDQVRYDPEVYLPRYANGFTELRVVADPQRGDMFRAMRLYDRTTNFYCEDRMKSVDREKYHIQFKDYIALNPCDIELLLQAFRCVRYITYHYKFHASIADDLLVMRRVLNTKFGHMCFRIMGPSCMNDEACVIAATKREGNLLQYASDRLKDDKAFVRSLILMENDNRIILFASDLVQQDIELWKLSIANDPEGKDRRRSFGDCPYFWNHDILRAEILATKAYDDVEYYMAMIGERLQDANLSYLWLSLRGIANHYHDPYPKFRDEMAKLPDDIVMNLANGGLSDSLFHHLSDAQRANKKIALGAVKRCAWNISDVGALLKEDLDINCAFLHGVLSGDCGLEDYELDECLDYLGETVRQHPDVQALVKQLTARYKRQRTF